MSAAIRNNPTVSFLVLCMALAAQRSSSAESAAPNNDSKPSRVVHLFDFDEREAGNVEDLPMHWLPVRPMGFPKFAGGRFDRAVGHNGPPSFYLSSEGRSVAFVYLGESTAVRARSDYQLEAFVRVDHLIHARACLTANFVDARGTPLLETMVRSPFLGGPEGGDLWTRVELLLPAAPSDVASIAVAVWILDERTWNERAAIPEFITRRDLAGGAWFDDILIRAVPRVELSSSRRENILSPADEQNLYVTLADQIAGELRATLSVVDVEQGVVLTQSFDVVTPATPVEPFKIPVDQLPPGLYTANLSVATEDQNLIRRTLSFARLEKVDAAASAPARGLGVVLMPDQRAEPAIEATLIRALGVGAVKIPIWTATPMDSTMSTTRRASEREFRELSERGVMLTAVLAGVPGALISPSGRAAVSLKELLNEPSELWRDYLVDAAGGDPQLYSAWQISADHAVDIVVQEEWNAGIDRLRSELQRLVSSPVLTAPVSALTESAGKSVPVDRMTVVLSRDTRSDEIVDQLERLRASGHDRPAAFVQTLDPSEFRRDSRLADFAQRLVSARHAGADPVYVPQPWQVRQTPKERVVEPTEEFLILRTLAHHLNDTRPGEPLHIAPGVRCLPFYNGESALVVVWDTQAPPGGRTHVTQLGRAERQVDLHGTSTALQRDEQGQHRLHLSSMPVIIDQVDRWLLTFRNSVRLEPEHVEAGLDVVQHTITLRHTGPFPLGGQVELTAPAGWELTPTISRFTMAPDQEAKLTLSIRYPPGEPAGRKSIIAKFSLLNDAHHLEVPLSVEIGLTDIDVEGAAVLDGDNLLLRHAITNRSKSSLDFRSSAQVPSQERQYRPINNLMPGETQIVEYRFSGVAGLAGSNVRLGLRPLADGRRVHNLELRIR